jgi:hypothetical protein
MELWATERERGSQRAEGGVSEGGGGGVEERRTASET